MVSASPLPKVSSKALKGRLADGLSKDASIEEIVLAANFLCAVMHGQGIIVQGEQLEIGGQKLTAKALSVKISIDKVMDTYLLTAEPLAAALEEDFTSVGMFMGALQAIAGFNKVSSGVTNQGAGRLLSFESKAQLVGALNKLARAWPEPVFPLNNPGNAKSAIDWLTSLAREKALPEPGA